MKDLIFLMDDPEDTFCTPLKMGNSLLNRFTIDEDAHFEVLGIHLMEKMGSGSASEERINNRQALESELLQKGTEM